MLGAKETIIEASDGWWFVSSDIDWLGVTSKVTVNEATAFETTHAFPEAGVNWHRSEVMARIFSDCCFTVFNNKSILISGELPKAHQLRYLLALSEKWVRTYCIQV